MSDISIHLIIPKIHQGQRLDAVMSHLLPKHSRTRIQNWIKSGDLLCNGGKCNSRDQVQGGEHIDINTQILTTSAYIGEKLPLETIYNDADIIIINKPAGLVTHPGAGNRSGTLVNALLYHFPELGKLPRAGVIHRLDKDTSGILVVAHTLTAHTYLVNELQQRHIKREYLALVQGYLTAGGTIDANIGRHPKARTKMAVVPRGKTARTHYRIIERFAEQTLLRVTLESGRTHQIRVHMAHIHHPLVGDPTYGKRRFPKKSSENLKQQLRQSKRQALHAYKLGLNHPQTGKYVEFIAPLPQDMETLLQTLRKENIFPT